MTTDFDITTADELERSLHERRNGDGGQGTAPLVVEARPKRRWPWLVAGLAVGAGGVLVAEPLLNGESDGEVVVAEPTALTTASVQVTDLVEEVEWDGELAAGETIDAAFASSSTSTDQAGAESAGGTITGVPEVGDTIERGDVVAWVDDLPVVAFYGDIPMWRDLAEGDEGEDVRQLEANLVRLGYDLDDDVVIDTEFDSDTETMVEAWQEDVGREETGVVAASDLVVLPGPSDVVSVPAVGASTSGETIVQLEAPAVRVDVVAGRPDADDDAGIIDSLAEVGTRIEHGSVLMTVDGSEVIAVVEVSPETETVLAALNDDDLEELEAVLAFMGYDTTGTLVVDGEVDEGTTAAIQAWQTDAGLPATGSIDPADYVVLDGIGDAAYSVSEQYLEVGDELDDSEIVLALATPTLTVTADIAVGSIDEFAVGDLVTVEQLDESTFDAAVISIADIATPGGADAGPTIAVEFEVVSEPDEFVSGSVLIVTESSRIDGATVVPTRALIALREGGYAVERQLADGSTELIGVEIGTFDDGLVEVVSSTADLNEGDDLVVPA
ncbi:putative peptidoglycan binding protein [Ilumatobacter fluminis]|uniref:Putative peptidoglycan binding protein n=1 Tax=Ilumatobacter fluminis TaxID=467091 RepID=A0A4R7I517_9ACTN|nr:peptidoglycan-binding protein [Ilumatobacter fluminis]TDT18089.1 putative peptidoglycan binding protein [Ilumatobacter fluminis]